MAGTACSHTKTAAAMLPHATVCSGGHNEPPSRQIPFRASVLSPLQVRWDLRQISAPAFILVYWRDTNLSKPKFSFGEYSASSLRPAHSWLPRLRHMTSYVSSWWVLRRHAATVRRSPFACSGCITCERGRAAHAIPSAPSGGPLVYTSLVSVSVSCASAQGFFASFSPLRSKAEQSTVLPTSA